jgi:hypothetical protein
MGFQQHQIFLMMPLASTCTIINIKWQDVSFIVFITWINDTESINKQWFSLTKRTILSKKG